MKLVVAAVLGVLILAVLYLAFAPRVNAARSQASCWFAGGWLFASGLPVDTPLSLTTEFYPTGVSWTTPDGTFAREYGYPSAYFWTRGGGPSLRKPGPQLNDYRLVAECHA